MAESFQVSSESRFDTQPDHDGHGSLTDEPLPFRAFTRKRLTVALVAILLVLALVLVPPLFNVGRYKRQIATSIASSLGRPVHIDTVTLSLLPLPGFTLEHFVVGEDPAFGAEPVLRADEVHATVRFSSLWRRRLEFSRIALTDPSINLVHLPDGRWNLESILLQASRMPAAPTAQRTSGSTPRFPYIEASGARINLKLGAEKTPFSLTEADASLWLPEPGQWHFRVKAHPTRTDTAVSDTGALTLEGTLGQAALLSRVPLTLRADWTTAPLGALSQILVGRDIGMRGTMELHAAVDGTAGDNRLTTQLHLESVRRADFVPLRSMSANIACSVHTVQGFHVVEAAHCTWPAGSEQTGMVADFQIPDIRRLKSTTGSFRLSDVPLAALLDTLRMASNRVSPELSATGLMSMSLSTQEMPAGSNPSATPVLTIPNATLSLPEQPAFVHSTLIATASEVRDGNGTLAFTPILLDLGGREPAKMTVQIVRSGIKMELVGEALPKRLHDLTGALPQFGDDLDRALSLSAQSDEAIPLNLVGEHTWMGGQSWQKIAATGPAHKIPAPRRHRGKRT